MLRSYDELGGVGVYTRNIVRELLAIDRENQYILFFRSPENMSRFDGISAASTRLIRGKNRFFWDQVQIPLACRREKLDVLFHPKFTVPLLAPCKTIMTVHGADWFIPEQAQYYPWWDVAYIRAMMPLYFRKASAVISVSDLTTENFQNALILPRGKLHTVYFAPARHFKRVTDRRVLDDVRARYNLPERFILTLTKRQGDKRKNLGTLVEAYAKYHARTAYPASLIIGGKDCHLYRDELQIPRDRHGKDIHFPGWIPQEDLPAIYTLADLYLYPSNLEAFPIPLTEAMACGTPIVTSNVNGLKEIADDAAVLIDPNDLDGIAQAIDRVLASPELQADLKEKGLARAELFSWDRCARTTLDIIESVARDGRS